MKYSRIILLVAVLCCVTTSIAAPVLGSSTTQSAVLQENSSDDATNESIWDAPSDDEDDGDGGAGSDDSGSDGSGAPDGDDSDGEGENNGILGGARSALDSLNPVDNVMSPADAAEDVWKRLTEMFASAMTIFVEEVFNKALGTPTINNDGAFGIFGTPETVEQGEQTVAHKEAGPYDAVASENYVTVYNEIYLGLVMPMSMSIMSFMALLMLIAPALTAITRRKVGSILASGVFVVMMTVGLWEYATLLHALSDAAVQWFLPSGEEVLDTDITTYSGGIATALILYFKGWVGGANLAVIHATRHALLYVYPAVLPLFFLMAYWGGHRRVKQVGSFFIWQWYGLLVMNIPTAILLAFANAVGWQIFPWETLNFLATLGIFALAVLIPFAVSGSFFLIGLSMRGAAVGTASAAVSKYAPSPRPASVFGGQRARSAKERLKRGGARAGTAAASRSKAAAQRARSSINSRRSVRTDGGSSSSGSNTSRSTTKGTDITPDQRRKAANHQQNRSRNANRLDRAREQKEHYRK